MRVWIQKLFYQKPCHLNLEICELVENDFDETQDTSQKNNDTNKNKENLSKENNLESLSIDNYEISFNKNTLSYSINVNYDVDYSGFDATLVEDKKKEDLNTITEAVSEYPIKEEAC